jgi:pimeloyl-ACP methyl ester carboxylesterase
METPGREIVERIAAGSFAEVAARFDEAMSRAMSADELAALWGAVQAQAGAFRAIESVRCDPAGANVVAAVTCAFERASLEIAVVFDASSRIAGLFVRPAASRSLPAYAALDRIEEREVTIGARYPLPATLTLPRDARLVPALVLVHGSGPNDRDETVGAVKPFRDLALGLASRGVAVLRYEKRTRVHGPALVRDYGESLTLEEETVEDALLAAALLRGLPAIDPARVFVLGHSQGGSAMARIARKDAALAGFILLAAGARPLEDAIVSQLEHLLSLDPDGAALRDELERARAAAGRVKRLATEPAPASELLLGIPAPYWLDLARDPPVALASEPRPILVLHGDRDYQVTSADFDAWKAALGSNAELRRYPRLNHVFVEGDGPSHPGEYLAAAHVALEPIEDIAAFVAAH